MKKNILLMLLLGQLAWITEASAQNIAINGTGSLPDTSAMLDVSSSNKGFLAPRMTSTQQNAIPLPANGLLIYNTTDNAFNVNTGTAASPVWTRLATGTVSATTNTLGSSVNTLTNTTNGIAASAPIVNTIGNTSSANTLTTTVNGIAATGVPIINSNALTNPVNTITSSVNGITSTAPAVNTNSLSVSGSTLTSTVNGVASAGLNLTAGVAAASTNTLTSSANVMTSTANGKVATASIVNTIGNTSSTNTLTTTVNGIAATGVSIINSNALTNPVNTITSSINGITSTAPAVNTNTLTVSGSTLTSTVNGVASAGLSLTAGVAAASTNTLTSSANIMTSTANGKVATAPIINTIGNTSSTNTLTTTVNGIAATGVSIINSNALTNPVNTITSSINGITSTAPAVNTNTLTVSGSTLTSTVNGVASTGLNLSAGVAAASTNTLSSSANVMTSTANGKAATASIVNSNSLSLSGTNLTSTVNGISSTALNLSPIFASSVWTLNGNTGIGQPAVPATYGTSTIGSSEDFLGTTDAKDLVFATNNVERVRLKNTTGYFGIGTAAPTKPLDIVKNLANEGLMKLQNTNAAGYSSIDIWSATQQIGNIGFSNGGASYPNAFYFATNTTNSMVFATNNIERLRMDGTTGNIGLGVAAPTAVLHIEAGTATAGTAPLKFTAGTNLSTVENGAVEYDGTNYFGTAGGVRYTLAKTLTASASLTFPSTAAGNSSDLTISVVGAQPGDVVSLGIPVSAVVTKGDYMAYVSASGVVTIKFTNNSGNTINLSSASFRVAVLRY